VCEQLVFALRGLTDKVSTLEQRLDTAESLVDHQNQVIKDLRLQNSTMAHQLNDLLAKKNGPPLLTQTPTQTDSRSRRGHNRSASLTVNMTRSSDTESSPTASSQHVSQISAVLASPAVLKIETWSMPFTFKCIGTFRGHSNGIISLIAKGQRLYSGSRDAAIRVWDMDALRRGCIHTLKGHTNTVHSLVIGGGCLFSAGADLSIRSWKLESLEQDHVAEYAHDNIISALAVAGPYLFSASLAQIKIWKIANLDCVHTITDLNHWVRALAVGDKKVR
jgi:E3 ubiquitin-protein ligase TRAF7